MSVSQLIERARQGFLDTGAPEEQRAAALEHLERWLTAPVFADYQPALAQLIEQDAWSLLLDSFYQIIPFGTGGRRGPVGIGPNRINPYTIATSVQGHSLFLQQQFADFDEKQVVIAYDVRVFRDLRERYRDADGAPIQSPVQDLSSRQLAHYAAEIYAANGIVSHLLPMEDQSYISTPELSFLIRSLGALGGLNVSASHNHPDDNGGKFYNERGGQPVPPRDQEMLDLVRGIEEVPSLPFEEAVAKELICWITPEARQGYIDLNAGLHGERREEPVAIAYSPMHGTGEGSVGEALRKAGYEVAVFPLQAEPNGAFPNVRYQMPNPEIPAAMQDVIEWAKEQGADLALATDPDADRLGLAAADREGEWRFFTGNEIAALLTWHRLARWREEGGPKPPLVLKTEVTTNLVERITEAHGGQCLGGLLVGFKYFGQALSCWERGESFLGLTADIEQYAMGSEESHGYLASPEVRDKDAAGAAVLLVEFACRLKAKGSNLCEAINALYMTHGYHCNRLVSMVMEGAEGIARIRQMQSELRKQPPEAIAGIPVVEHFDHWDESGRFGPIVSETDRSSRNVQVFHLEDNIRLILRPSGTEPKAKMYIEVPTQPQPSLDQLKVARLMAETEAAALAESFMQQALKSIGIELPIFALRASDLLSIDSKIAFVKEVIPGWKQRMAAQSAEGGEAGAPTEADVEWLRNAIAPLGKAPKEMFLPAVEALRHDSQDGGLTAEEAQQFYQVWEQL